MSQFARIFAVADKDIRSELRTRYALTATGLFILTTISMIVFATAGEKLTPELSAGILWIVMFFGSMTGLSKSFVSEEERGTNLFLQMTTTPLSIYLGKFIYTLLLCLFLSISAIILFFLFTGIEVKSWLIFIPMTLLGCLGLSAATTIISAIIAKAGTKNALFPVLAFPLLLPLILAGVESTMFAFVGAPWAEAQANIIMMASYSVVVVAASTILFDFVWVE